MINRNLYFKGRPEWTIYLLNGIKELLNRIKELFEQNECMHIYNHSLQVVNNAVELANRFHVRKEIKNNVYIAALLHDVGGIYPNDQRVLFAKRYGIELVAKEYYFPLIIHQKISRYL